MSPDLGSDTGLEARYANLFKVGHNPTEFLIQFGQFQTGAETVWLTRIVLSPPFAKEFVRMMTESIERYEEVFEPIRFPGVTPEDEGRS